MKQALAWLAVLLSGGLAASGIGAFSVATQTRAQAETTRDGAVRLRDARLDLVKAQNALGESDLEAAVEGAERANAAAERVRSNASRLLEQLRVIATDVAAVTETSASSGRSLSQTKARMRLVSALLRAVRGEQRAASDATAHTTRFLRRILAAVRETNRSLP